MKRTYFNSVVWSLIQISKMNEPARTNHLDLFMSQGYIFLDLTEKQIAEIKTLFKTHFSDIYKEYHEPDEHGFIAEFKYLRFK